MENGIKIILNRFADGVALKDLAKTKARKNTKGPEKLKNMAMKGNFQSGNKRKWNIW